MDSIVVLKSLEVSKKDWILLGDQWSTIEFAVDCWRIREDFWNIRISHLIVFMLFLKDAKLVCSVTLFCSHLNYLPVFSADLCHAQRSISVLATWLSQICLKHNKVPPEHQPSLIIDQKLKLRLFVSPLSPAPHGFFSGCMSLICE